MWNTVSETVKKTEWKAKDHPDKLEVVETLCFYFFCSGAWNTEGKREDEYDNHREVKKNKATTAFFKTNKKTYKRDANKPKHPYITQII